MNSAKVMLSISMVAGLAACTVNPPLLFGDTVTFGLQLGTNAAAGGGNVTLGLRQHSVAVVPLSVLNEKGDAQALRGWSENHKDALSVFAVFETSTTGPTDRLRLGQVFSTGLAAQLLTEGYACRFGGANACAPNTPASSASATTATGTSSPSTATAAGASSPAPTAAAATSKTVGGSESTSPDRIYQLPLVYARTDTFGIDISGSAAEQNSVFTVGYTARNLAVVPTYATSSGQRVTGLFGQAGDDSKSRDAYSVLGQFKASTQTSGLGFGIERFFATGIAAQNLGRGLRAAIATPPAQSAAQ